MLRAFIKKPSPLWQAASKAKQAFFGIVLGNKKRGLVLRLVLKM